LADEIHLLNGQTVTNAKITRMSADELEYKVGDREIVYSAKKADVEKVVYSDGTQDVFTAQAAPPPPPPPPPAPVAPAPVYTAAPAPTPVRAPKPPKEGGNDWYGGIEGRIAYSAFPTEFSSPGYGILGGAALLVVLSDAITFKPELNFSYRVPWILKDDANTNYAYDKDKGQWVITRELSYRYSEFAIGVQALFQGSLISNYRLFFDGGVKLDIPIGTKQHTVGTAGIVGAGESLEISQLRSNIDIGVIYGFSFMITDKIAFNVRNTTIINDFFIIQSGAISQLDVGLTILLSGISL
jgi:hypothetical protein